VFINDLTDIIDYDAMTGKYLELLSMHLILFADDMVLFTTDRVSLKAQLNSIKYYSSIEVLK
jgi:hypothetical protein